jgi:dethiobiotin synthetase/adenosylmethionine--8-amino-7-oxononanoate aminotransferase
VLNHTPDIAVYAKILTGGLLPMSTTLASSSIFNAFLSDKKVDALLHGHSYTANPIGTSVALESIKMVERHLAGGGFEAEKKSWNVGHLGEEGRWSFWSPDFIERVSKYSTVKGSMAMGTVLAIELEDTNADYGSLVGRDFLDALKKETVKVAGGEEFKIHSRPLGNVIYVMTSLFTKPAVVRAMEEVMEKRIKVAEAAQ